MSPSMSPSMSLSRKEVWSLVHAERRRLIDDLSTVEGTDWETRSRCPGCTVHDVLAHLVDVARIGKVGFLRRKMRAKRDFDLANEEGVRHYRHDDPVQTLEDFRQSVTMIRIPTRTPGNPSRRGGRTRRRYPTAPGTVRPLPRFRSPLGPLLPAPYSCGHRR